MWKLRGMSGVGLLAVLMGCAPRGGSDEPASVETVRIEAGNFWMGSPESEEGRMPNEVRREVTITKRFRMGRYPVTVAQFERFVKETGHLTAAETEGWATGAWNPKTNAWDRMEGASWRNPGFGQGEDHPVVNVDWGDAQAYCRWLSGKEGRKYRLPTEAEWEYACRAGEEGAYSWGALPVGGEGKLNGLDEGAKGVFTLFPPFGWTDGYVHTAPVKAFAPNRWGLYDMLGNTLEWCEDWYEEKPPAEAAVDPRGPAAGTQRCLRGGAFVYGPKHCRNAFRGRNFPGFRCYYIGFRVVRE